jgi:aminopeptidase N
LLPLTFNALYNIYKNSPLDQSKVASSLAFASYLAKVKDAGNVKKGVEEIMKFRNMIPEQYRGFIDPGFKKAFTAISAAQKVNGNNELADYLDGLIK